MSADLCATRSSMSRVSREIPGRRGGMVGDRPRQLPRIPLPDLVRALTFVRGNKLGWLARTLPIVGNVDVSSE